MNHQISKDWSWSIKDGLQLVQIVSSQKYFDIAVTLPSSTFVQDAIASVQAFEGPIFDSDATNQ